MKKRKALLAMALAMALSLTACWGGGDKKSPNQGASGQTTASGVKAEISVQAEEAWVPYYEAAIQRVKEKNPDATITIRKIGAFDHLDTIDNTDATNKDVADVMALPADRLYGMAQNQILADLDSEAMAKTIGGWDDFNKGLGGNFKVDGKYLAFPMNIETLITYANVTNAEKQGIKLDQPLELNDIKTPEEILIPIHDCWFGVAAANAGGLELLNKGKDGKLVTDMVKDFAALNEDQKAVITGIYNYWAKHNEKKTPLFDKKNAMAWIDEQTKTGNGGVLRLGGPWEQAPIKEKVGDGKLALYPIGQITIAGKPLQHWQGGWGLGINSRIEGDKDKMALAVALIEEIVNPKFAESFYQTTGKILENVSKDDYMKMDKLSEEDKAIIAATIDGYQKAVSRPLFKEYSQVWDTWQNGMLSWNAEQPQNAEAAYKLLQDSFKAMMANFK